MSDLTSTHSGRIHAVGRYFSHAYFLCAVLLFGALVHNHYQLVLYPYPLDYSEPTVPTFTAMIAEGKNPYSLENQPARTSVYPVMVNLVAAPLSQIFGNSLLLHRLVSAFSILASAMLVGLLLYRHSGSLRNSFVAATLAYGGFLYYSTPMSGPTGLALLFFLATIALPWLTHFSRTGLIMSVLFGILAFYTKQYFIIGPAYVGLYLFLFRSKKSGIQFGLFFSIVLLLTIPPVTAIAPYYFDATFFAGFAAGMIASTQVMLQQLRDYSFIVYPLFIILALQAINYVYGTVSAQEESTTRKIEQPHIGKINLSDPDAPLFTFGCDYFLLCLLCSTAIFVFILGTNPGNYLSYLFQLVSPFLILLVLKYAEDSDTLRPVYQLLLVIAMYNLYAMQSKDFSVKNEENWQEVRELIANSKHVYVSNILLMDVLQSGLEVYQDGHTGYFYFASLKPAFFKRDRYEESVEGIWENYVKKIHRMIRNQEFDTILIDPWTKIPGSPAGAEYQVDGRELLARYYNKRRVLPVSAANRPGRQTFRIEVWTPKGETASQPDGPGEAQKTGH